jgi:hypothetical protein
LAGLLLNKISSIHQPYLEGDPMKNTSHPIEAFKHFELLVLILAPLVTAACSGGSSGSIAGNVSVRALSLPDRIELVRAEVQNPTGRAAIAAGLFRGAGDDAGGYYNPATEPTRMDDTDVLDMVNGILGVVRETGYAGFVNQGPYAARVRQLDGSRQSPSGNSATSAILEQLMEFHVEVARASNSSPMIVKVRVEDKKGSGQGSILVRGTFSVTQGVSATFPYGVMFAHLKGTALDSEGTEVADLFTVAMSVGAGGGNVVIQDVGDNNEMDAYETHRRVRVAADVDAADGKACLYEAETDRNNPKQNT